MLLAHAVPSELVGSGGRVQPGPWIEVAHDVGAQALEGRLHGDGHRSGMREPECAVDQRERVLSTAGLSGGAGEFPEVASQGDVVGPEGHLGQLQRPLAVRDGGVDVPHVLRQAAQCHLHVS